MKKAIAILLSIILVMVFILPASAISTITVKSVKLNSAKVSLNVGDTYKLKVTFTPANTTQKKLTYATGNKKIATVDGTGKITGISAGKAVITVYTPNKKVFVKCNVTVIKVQPVTLKIISQDSYNAQASYSKGNPVLSEIEKRTNTKLVFEVYPVTNFYQVIKTRIAAGADMPDILNGYCVDMLEFSTYVDSGLFIPIDGLINQYAPNIKKAYEVTYPFLKKRQTLSDGHIYDVKPIEDSPSGYFQLSFIRTDWLQKVGITKMPTTTDEFYEALKAMQDKDANGNNKKDERYYSFPYQMLVNFQGAFGATAQLIWQRFDADSSGKVFCPWTSNEIKNTYAYLNKLFSEGLIDPEILSMGFDWAKLQSKISANVVSATNNAVTAIETQENSLMKAFGGNFQALPQLKGPTGKSNVPMTIPPAAENGYHYVITKACKNPIAAIKLLNFMYSDEAIKLNMYGKEGVTYNMVNGVPVFTAEYQDVVKRQAYGINLCCLPVITKQNTEEAFALNKVPAVDQAAYKATFPKAFVPYESGLPNKDQAAIVSGVGADIWTYVDEMRGKFITGKEPMSNWDAYVAQCNKLGLDKLLVVEQQLYNKFMGKK